MPSEKPNSIRYPISRRAFLEAAAAAGLTGLACEGATDPVAVSVDLNPEGLVSLVEGLTTPVQMERLGGFGTERVFSGGSSHPRELIETFRWYMGGSGLPVKFVDFGEEIEFRFAAPGKTTIELRVSSLADKSSDSVTMSIDVLPPVLPGNNNYEDTQIAFFRGESENKFRDDIPWSGALYFMDRDNPHLTSRIIRPGLYDFNSSRISWEPSARKLAFAVTRGDSPNNTVSALLAYDTSTGQSDIITTGAYIAQPDWSPLGDWLAYRTVERDPDISEIAFVRPDGSEKFFLAGEDGPHDRDRGVFPTFDPTGERLAVGLFGNEHNIAIFDDLWGRPSWRELLSYRQIREFATRLSGRSPSPAFYALAGLYGLDWSPDGEHIVFEVMLHDTTDPVEDSFYLNFGIARARVDGTGDIELLESENGHNPSYSPDGSHIFYEHWAQRAPPHIWRMSVDGSSKEDLTIASGAPPETFDYAATR